MTTIALPRGRQLKIALPSFGTNRTHATPFSTLAIASIGCIALFVSFIIAYQFSAFENMASVSKALLSTLFVVLAPAFALVFSTLSLRRYVKMHTKVRGMVLAYISFVISAIYFAAALAMPVVLLGMYLVYVYVW